DGSREVDVAQALTTHLGLDHLDAALLAHHTTVLHALVLAAVALVVLHGPEDLCAEQTVALGLEGTVVDRLRRLHFAVGPLTDLVRRRQADPDGAERKRVLRLLEEVEDIFHEVLPSLLLDAGLVHALDARRDLVAVLIAAREQLASDGGAVCTHF